MKRNESTTPQAVTPNGPDARTLIAFGTIVVVLGLNFVAVRYSNKELPPFWGAAIRFTIASLLLFALVAVKGVALPRGKALAGAVLYGLLAVGALYSLLYWALLYVPAGMSSVLLATAPLMTLLLASAIGQERLHWRGLTATVGAVVGIGVAFTDHLSADVPVVALLAVLGGALFAALSGIVVKGFPRSHPLATNAVAMAVGALFLFAGSIGAQETVVLPSQAPTWMALMWLVASSCIGFVLMIWVLSRWTASATSYTTVLMPLVATISGALLAGEMVGISFAVGGLLVIVSVYLGALSTAVTTGPGLQTKVRVERLRP